MVAHDAWLRQIHELVTSHLSGMGARRISAGEWRFACPDGSRHSNGRDDSPSCDWNEEKGLWLCRSCGAKGNASMLVHHFDLQLPDRGAEALAEAKRKLKIGAPPNKKKTSAPAEQKLVRTWVYTNESGLPLIEVARFEPGANDRPKDFKQRAYGDTKWGLGDTRRVLYRLPDLVAAPPGSMILLAEGEKNADDLLALGLTATTNLGGGLSWREEYTPFFTGQHVVILQDNDKTGIERTAKVAPLLAAVAASVRVLAIPGLATKGDVSDWLAAGHTKEELLELIGRLPSWQATVPKLVEINLTEMGNARRMALRHGHNLRWVEQTKRWYIWNGRYWQHDRLSGVVSFAKGIAGDLWKEARLAMGDTQEALEKWAKASESLRTILATLALVKTEPGIGLLPDDLDNQPMLLSAANGIINLVTGALLDPDPKYYLTSTSSVTYDPQAQCPTWMGFLEWLSLGRSEIIDYLQRVCGYCLTGATSEQVVFILVGDGDNGKSTFTDVLCEILGERLATHADPDLLIETQRDKHPTTIADLMGRRLAITQEVGAGKMFDEVTLKRLTGETREKARFMGQDFFEFTATHKLMISCNDRPGIRSQGHSVWRRIRIIPFDARVTDDQRDPHFIDKLRAEYVGILAWMVEGTRRWRMEGLAAPQVIQESIAEYRESQDILGGFLERCAVFGEEHSVVSGEFYSAYQFYCEVEHEQAVSHRTFTTRLTERRGIMTKRMWDKANNNSTRGFVGVGLANDPRRSLAKRCLDQLDL